MGVIVVVVIVAAMFVMMMVVIMTVSMAVIVVGMMAVIVRVIVTMRVAFLRRRVGAALGIERRLDLDDARAEPLHHRLDDVVAADAQALGHDLGRQMAVAEVPGQPHQVQRIGAADFQQRLGRRHHLDQAAVFQRQRIAAAQGDGVFEVEQEFEPARARHRHPPPVPVVKIEHDGVGGGLRPAMLAQDFCGADHWIS